MSALSCRRVFAMLSSPSFVRPALMLPLRWEDGWGEKVVVRGG